ncbi:MAG: hypothetical protein V2I65_13580 [Paracoccaceae bacterium]|jgi:hypothetical protein|nr:hypothetical protein [Paracoccaceae bacterium]
MADGMQETPDTAQAWREDGLLSAAKLKARLAEELATLARDMTTFQHTLSVVLETGRLSPDQLRRLQDLDRATQMLDNLHRVATALAAAHPHPVAATDLDSLVTLADLKSRLAGAPPAPAATDRRDPSDDEVAWL